MHLALSVSFFFAAASVEVLSFAPRDAVGDVWGGINITQMVFQVSGAISSPTCNATSNCTEFTTVQIPACSKFPGDPTCWCSNVNPLHYCAICMSSPTDNTTTPDQTQAALVGHQNYHIGCNAYEAYINGTSTSSTTSSSISSSSSSSAYTTPTQAAIVSSPKSVSAGTIGGVVVGGLVGLAVVGAIVFLLYRYMQNKHERITGSTPGASILSSPQSDPKTHYPYGPGTMHTPPLLPEPQRENAPYDTSMLYSNS